MARSKSGQIQVLVALFTGFVIFTHLDAAPSWGGGRLKVIYGDDDRLDLYQVTQGRQRELADSTVALIKDHKLTRSEDGASYTIEVEAYKEEYGLCSDEPFVDQVTAAGCSGSLVGADLILTAGHCIETQTECENTNYVFGFGVTRAGEMPTTVAASEVYGCAELIVTKQEDDGADFAILRLDRAVTGHAPLAVSRRGNLDVGAGLVVIGHPAGLPTKVSAGAGVRDNSHEGYYVANLDTYGGNSGSAVFNTETNEIEGVLVRGERDYTTDPERGCTISLRCTNDGCRGEDVTKISQALPYLDSASVRLEITDTSAEVDAGRASASLRIVIRNPSAAAPPEEAEVVVTSGMKELGRARTGPILPSDSRTVELKLENLDVDALVGSGQPVTVQVKLLGRKLAEKGLLLKAGRDTLVEFAAVRKSIDVPSGTAEIEYSATYLGSRPMRGTVSGALLIGGSASDDVIVVEVPVPAPGATARILFRVSGLNQTLLLAEVGLPAAVQLRVNRATIKQDRLVLKTEALLGDLLRTFHLATVGKVTLNGEGPVEARLDWLRRSVIENNLEATRAARSFRSANVFRSDPDSTIPGSLLGLLRQEPVRNALAAARYKVLVDGLWDARTALRRTLFWSSAKRKAYEALIERVRVSSQTP